MLHTLDQMFAPAPPVVATGRTWVAIPAFLEAEVAAGASSSSRDKARSAVRGLLRARRLAPENAPVCLDWFDRTFPPDGWDHAMSFEHGTWRDYIYRVRPVLERMTGADVARKATRELEDDWSEAGEHLGGLDMFSNSGGGQSLIPILSTLTNAARREGLRTRDIDDARFRDLYEKAGKGEKRSLRSASALLATIRSSEPSTRMWFPHPITPIEAPGPFRYEVPPQLEAEIGPSRRDGVQKALHPRQGRVRVRVRRNPHELPHHAARRDRRAHRHRTPSPRRERPRRRPRRSGRPRRGRRPCGAAGRERRDRGALGDEPDAASSDHSRSQRDRLRADSRGDERGRRAPGGRDQGGNVETRHAALPQADREPVLPQPLPARPRETAARRAGHPRRRRGRGEGPDREGDRNRDQARRRRVFLRLRGRRRSGAREQLPRDALRRAGGLDLAQRRRFRGRDPGRAYEEQGGDQVRECGRRPRSGATR